MALTQVIFDNTIFNYILKIQSVDFNILLRSIISDKILIPIQIIPEMESLANNEPQFRTRILKWIDQVNRKSFFHICASYDSIIFDTIKRKLDEGEAGAIAQAEKRGVYWFLSDDIKNIKFIKQNYGNIHQHSFFFLISLADILGLLPDYESVLIDFLEISRYNNRTENKKRNFKKHLRDEYIAALQMSGLHFNKKVVSQKTSISKILERKVS